MPSNVPWWEDGAKGVNPVPAGTRRRRARRYEAIAESEFASCATTSADAVGKRVYRSMSYHLLGLSLSSPSSPRPSSLTFVTARRADISDHLPLVLPIRAPFVARYAVSHFNSPRDTSRDIARCHSPFSSHSPPPPRAVDRVHASAGNLPTNSVRDASSSFKSWRASSLRGRAFQS